MNREEFVILMFVCLDEFMGDVDKDEIDLDEEENEEKDDVEDIARFVYLIQ